MQKQQELFFKVYYEQLAEAVANHPEEYAWNIEQLPEVFARMKAAILKGTFNKDSRAIKATCKQLYLKHTYKEIKAYLFSEDFERSK